MRPKGRVLGTYVPGVSETVDDWTRTGGVGRSQSANKMDDKVRGPNVHVGLHEHAYET